MKQDIENAATDFTHKGSFRNSAAFGKRIEYYLAGLLLKDGFDVFLPLVDDDGIDAILRGKNGRKIYVQIKARSKTVKFGNCALFSTGHSHEVVRGDFVFLFYCERLQALWIMPSHDYLAHCSVSKSGKNKGWRKIKLNGASRKFETEYPNERFKKWLVGVDGNFDFSSLHAALAAS